MRRKIAILMAAAALAAAAPPARAAEQADVSARLLAESARRGDRIEVEVRLAPARGVKLYRHMTKVTLTGSAPVELGQYQAPAGHKVYDELLEETVEYYEGPTTFTVPVRVSPDAPVGRLAFTLQVHFQGCTAILCHPPAAKDFTLELAVEDAPASDSEKSWAQRTAEGGGLMGILSALLLGLLVSVTPCVYPMIPVTVALIGSAAAGKDGVKKKSTLLAYTLVYVLGISITYAVLGLIAASTGRAIGSMMNHPAVLVFVGLVMAALALSMFGAFDLKLPAALTGRLGRLQGGGSLPMLLVSGLVMGLVASPCVSAPLAGLLLAIGKSGSLFIGGLSLFAFAWGMSVLLIVSGIFPGFMARPGAWMNTVKLIFGVVMTAAGLYFVRDLLPAALFGWAGLAAMLLIGAGLLTAARRLAAGGHGRGLVSGLGSISLVLAFYLALGFSMRTGALVGAIESVLPAGVKAEIEHESGPRVTWTAYTPEAFDAAQRENRPVVIDFSASWCKICEKLEKTLFSDPEVIAETERFVRLRVDGSDTTDPAAQAAVKRFGGGYPTIVVFAGDGRETGKFYGDAMPDAFLAKLRPIR